MTCDRCTLWTGFLLATIALTATGQNPPSPDKEAESTERLEQMKRQAAQYVVKLHADPPAELTLHEEPLLRFHVWIHTPEPSR